MVMWPDKSAMYFWSRDQKLFFRFCLPFFRISLYQVVETERGKHGILQAQLDERVLGLLHSARADLLLDRTQYSSVLDSMTDENWGEAMLQPNPYKLKSSKSRQQWLLAPIHGGILHCFMLGIPIYARFSFFKHLHFEITLLFKGTDGPQWANWPLWSS